MKKVTSLLVLGVMVLSTACGTARVVNVKPRKGGVIAISSYTNSADRSKAQAIMAENCAPMNYEITEEGETVVGKAKAKNTQVLGTTQRSTYGTGAYGLGGVSSSGSSVELTEWRISYECK